MDYAVAQLRTIDLNDGIFVAKDFHVVADVEVAGQARVVCVSWDRKLIYRSASRQVDRVRPLDVVRLVQASRSEQSALQTPSIVSAVLVTRYPFASAGPLGSASAAAKTNTSPVTAAIRVMFIPAPRL
jgi:hypothetical protein